MVRGLDYYDYARAIIEADEHITWIHEQVTSVVTDADPISIRAGETRLTAGLAFRSYADSSAKHTDALTTLQHFGGWYIKSETDQWDSSRAVFMDFRTEQQEGQTRFCYVLPVSAREALVEVAIYSEAPWSQDRYDAILSSYIEEYMSPIEYTITEREYGVIPMSTARFWQQDTQRLIHIGTAGGAVKPSSGYAFGRIHEHSEWIVDRILAGQTISGSPFRSRYYHYDATLLHVLLVQQLDSEEIFHWLFRRNDADSVLAFLNGESTWWQELKLCASMPVAPFTRGLLHSLAT
jgi:lycopene beta-cyclase